MRNKFSGKVVIIGVVAVAILAFVLLMVPGLAADEFDTLEIQTGSVDQCRLVTIDGGGKIVFDLYPAHKLTINAQQGEDGNVLYHCKVKDFQFPVEETTKYNSETLNGVSCRIIVDPSGFGYSTENWEQVITTSGEATLSCRGNPSG